MGVTDAGVGAVAAAELPAAAVVAVGAALRTGPEEVVVVSRTAVAVATATTEVFLKCFLN